MSDPRYPVRVMSDDEWFELDPSKGYDGAGLIVPQRNEYIWYRCFCGCLWEGKEGADQLTTMVGGQGVECPQCGSIIGIGSVIF